MLGVNTPVVPFQHQFLVTEEIEGLPPNLPTIRDKDNLIYYKEEVGGRGMGGYERNGIAWGVDGVSNDFISQLLDENFDHFQQLSDPAMQRTPCLAEAGIRLMAMRSWARHRSSTMYSWRSALTLSASLPEAVPGA
jgi:4-methylaminobutanoate oxidase (formaldehyde-forming)